MTAPATLEHATDSTPLLPGPVATQWSQAPVAVPAPAEENERGSNVDHLWSESPRGALPVLDHMNLGENLVVFGHADSLRGLTGSPTATFTDPTVEVLDVAIAGNQVRAVLRPTSVGAVLGVLRIGEDKLAALFPIAVGVSETPTATSWAGRNLSVESAKNSLKDSLTYLHEQRKAGLTVFSAEALISDPVEQSVIETVMMAAVEIAIGSVTAGIGVVVAEAAKHALKAGDAIEEVIKVATEESLSATASYGLDKMMTDAANGAPHDSKGKLHMTFAGAFKIAQINLLNTAHAIALDNAETDVLATAKASEIDNPGSGYLTLMAIAKAIRTAGANAPSVQVMKSLQAYATMQAQSALGTTDAGVGPRPSAAGGTDLGNTGVPVAHTGFTLVPGESRTAGVLRLTLERDADAEYRIARARVHGLNNGELLSQLGIASDT